jgi:hypothetical protein
VRPLLLASAVQQAFLHSGGHWASEGSHPVLVTFYSFPCEQLCSLMARVLIPPKAEADTKPAAGLHHEAAWLWPLLRNKWKSLFTNCQ